MGRLRRETLRKLPEAKRFDLLDAMRNRLRDLIKSGDFQGDPKQWWPAVEIVALAYAPDTPPMLKFACLKTAADLVHIPVSAQAKIDAGVSDTNITVVVQGWAANKPAAIEIAPNTDATSPTRSIEDSRGPSE